MLIDDRKGCCPGTSCDLRHLLQDVTEVVGARPFEIHGDAEHPVEPIPCHTFVREQGDHLITRSSNRRVEHRITAPLRDVHFDALPQRRKFRWIAPDLDGIDVGAFVGGDPGWQSFGAREHDRAAAGWRPPEEEFRERIAGEGKRDQVVSVVGRTKAWRFCSGLGRIDVLHAGHVANQRARGNRPLPSTMISEEPRSVATDHGSVAEPCERAQNRRR